MFAGLVLAGMLATVAAQAAESASTKDERAMCREVAFTEYARSNAGPAGKHVEIVKTTKRNRLVCNEAWRSEMPRRAAAIVRHYKTA